VNRLAEPPSASSPVTRPTAVIAAADMTPIQEISVLSHNLLRSFQLRSAFAEPKPRSRQENLRLPPAQHEDDPLLAINRAARIARIDGPKRSLLHAQPRN
jgi:hypothetical protein